MDVYSSLEIFKGSNLSVSVKMDKYDGEDKPRRGRRVRKEQNLDENDADSFPSKAASKPEPSELTKSRRRRSAADDENEEGSPNKAELDEENIASAPKGGGWMDSPVRNNTGEDDVNFDADEDSSTAKT